MKEKPILFSTPMVKAILKGRKTMTRRVIRPRYRPGETGFVVSRGLAGTAVSIIDEDGCMVREESPKYWPGDILYVRETWCALIPEHIIDRSYAYRANTSADSERIRKEYIQCNYPYQWRPSIHMPRKAARLFLEVKSVRIERLRDITEEDAKAEGILPTAAKFGGCKCRDRPDRHGKFGCPKGCNCFNARENFFGLWDSLNAKRVDAEKKPVYSWESNPWVWVYEFERVGK